MKSEDSSIPFVMKSLTVEEIKAQAVLFLIAGYETSSNALAFTTFLLANNPEAEEKLYQEIKAKFSDPSIPINYDTVQDIKYLEWVISESMRMFPVAALVTNRLAMDGTTIEGIPVPKDVPVQVDVWSVHYDPEIWGPVDPYKFHPERFSDDYPTASRDSASFLTFGFGPRICIGMRFAQLEIRMALVNLLLKYRICKSPSTGDKLDLNVASTMSPKNGVWVKLEKR